MMNKDQIAELLEFYPDLMTMDGFDDCIIGVSQRIGSDDHFAYSTKKVINKLMGHGMSYEDAREFFEFNQLGAWVGPSTPCFIEDPNEN